MENGEDQHAISETRQPFQADVLAWARERWPDRCDPVNRALKVGEEAGEVLGAVVRMGEGRGSKAHLAQELAQLALCTMALAEAADIDLPFAVSAEWSEIQERVW